MSPVSRVAFFAAVWAAWLFPFFIARLRLKQTAVKTEPRARWGILLVAVGFFLTFIHGPQTWRSDLPPWRLAIAIPFAAMAIVLSWTAVPRLGKHWRVDAGLNADHELVKTGPYRFVRHPIYASMLAMLLTAIAVVGTLPGWPVGIAFFIAGTEIRVHIEDALLRSRFGAEFEEWKTSVPAYLPFVR